MATVAAEDLLPGGDALLNRAVADRVHAGADPQRFGFREVRLDLGVPVQSIGALNLFP